MHRFVDVVKALKRRRGTTVACPRCGSLKISGSTGMDGWMLPPLYCCQECGYSGRLVLEVDRDAALGMASDTARNDAVPNTER
jgi:transcription elongation factor Elf1